MALEVLTSPTHFGEFQTSKDWNIFVEKYVKITVKNCRHHPHIGGHHPSTPPLVLSSPPRRFSSLTLNLTFFPSTPPFLHDILSLLKQYTASFYCFNCPSQCTTSVRPSRPFFSSPPPYNNVITQGKLLRAPTDRTHHPSLHQSSW